MNGADRLCDVLLVNDVDVCFANPGTSEMHFVAALDRKQAMRCILGLFEGVVTGAADGFARMAGKPAATLLHTGPGLANGLANLHNARRARSPMINVVGDHASYHLKFDAPLTSDIESLARPMSHWMRRIAGAGDVGPATEAAYQAAMLGPGISTLILPADAAWGEVAPAPLSKIALPALKVVPRDEIRQAAQALRKAPARAGLVLSDAVLRADSLALASRLSAETGIRLFTGMQIGRMERGGPWPVEKIPYAVDLALALLKDIDVLVLVGARPPVAFFAYPNKPSSLVGEACDLIELGQPGDDIAQALAALVDEFSLPRTVPSLSKASAPPEAVMPSEGPLSGQAVAQIIAELLPENSIICDEGITSTRNFFPLSKRSRPHDYLMITGGAIGIGLPLCVGAAVACPDRKVIGLQADGSAMYTVQGLWTQARENLDVTTIIFSNRTYAILQGEMKNVGVEEFGRNASLMLNLDEPAIDWVKIASGMGVEAARAESCETFIKLFKGALQRRGPYLIEAII